MIGFSVAAAAVVVVYLLHFRTLKYLIKINYPKKTCFAYTVSLTDHHTK